MADLKTRRVAREKLAKVLGSHEVVVAFENLTDDVKDSLPNTDAANAAATARAQAVADSAALAAEDAGIAAQRAQLDATAALEATASLGTDPGISAVLAELQALRNRVAALEQGVTA